jgi:streptomycin 6-kinase
LVVADLDLPESFRRRVLTYEPELRTERAGWLRDLPDVVATLAERWGLSLGEAYPSFCNYVVAATTEEGDACVLKIGPPVPEGGEGILREAIALGLAGPAAIGVLDADTDAGALLLERATGGPLSAQCERDDDRATEILASALGSWWVPAGAESGLPKLAVLEDTFEEFDRGPHGASYRGRDIVATLAEIDSGMRDLREAAVTARRVFQELLADRAPEVVVHGDLHHENVLEDETKGWAVIDPKGFVGDAGYDTGAMLYNPFAYTSRVPDIGPLVQRRLDIVGNIVGMDRELLTAWGYVKAVLSLLWAVEGEELERDDVRLRLISDLRHRI